MGGFGDMDELNYWQGRLKKGAISRREFLGRAAALGASAAAISSALVSVDAFAAETPKKGGTLRLCGVASRIASVLKLTKTDELFGMDATREESLAALGVKR